MENANYSIDPTDAFMFGLNGITLFPGKLTGEIHIPFSASKCVGFLCGDANYTIPKDTNDTVKFRIKYLALYYTYDTNTSSWVTSSSSSTWGDIATLSNMATFPELTGFEIQVQLTRTLATDEPPSISWLGFLYQVEIEQMDRYALGKLSAYISSLDIEGHLGIGQITSHVNGTGQNVITYGTDFTIPDQYEGATIQAVMHRGSDILSSVSSNDCILSTVLNNDDVTILFYYHIQPMFINQSLDFVEIEKYPVLIIDEIEFNLGFTNPIELAFKNYGAGTAYVVQWDSCVVNKMRVTTLGTLFWDNLAIWSKFNDGWAKKIDMPEIGKSCGILASSSYKEVVTKGSSEGTKPLSRMINFYYPSPIPNVVITPLVQSININGIRSGG